jgi:hypothetical protein
MTRRQLDIASRSGGWPLAIDRLVFRAGVAIAALALPLTVGTGLVLVLTAPSLTAGFDSTLAAATGTLGPPDGVGWVFHVTVLGLLASAWLTGLGLVLSELFE